MKIAKDKHEEELEKILKGLELAWQRLLKFKKEKNSPLVVIRDGKMVHLMPDEF